MSQSQEKIRKGYVYIIYGIEQNGNISDEVYIGSTYKNIKGRFSNHKMEYRNNQGHTQSHLIFEKYGIKNCRIKVIAEVDTYNKELLYLLEGALIMSYGDKVVNRSIPGRYVGVPPEKRRSNYIKNYVKTEKGRQASLEAKRRYQRKPEQVEKRKQKWMELKEKLRMADELINAKQKANLT